MEGDGPFEDLVRYNKINRNKYYFKEIRIIGDFKIQSYIEKSKINGAYIEVSYKALNYKCILLKVNRIYLSILAIFRESHFSYVYVEI